jgi:hypothetical protein
MSGKATHIFPRVVRDGPMDDPCRQRATDTCAEAMDACGRCTCGRQMKTQGGRQPTNVAVPAWEVYTRHQAALGVV